MMDLKTNELGFPNEYPNIYFELESVERLYEGGRFVSSYSYRLKLLFHGGHDSKIAKLRIHLLKCQDEKILMEDVLPFGPSLIMVAFRGYIESVEVKFNGLGENYSLEVYVQVAENNIMDITRFINQKTIDSPVQNF